MTDTDRLSDYLARNQRTLDDGCGCCGFSLVYCRCVTYIDGPDARCCNACNH